MREYKITLKELNEIMELIKNRQMMKVKRILQNLEELEVKDE